jgi:diadenosine tetraphosphatase ApaH/serine/threonine PP2A family protein phosphatase
VGLEREGIDRLLCAGDLVGFGSQPNECVELLAAKGALCVAGNHDLMALDQLDTDRCSPRAREAVRWTRRVLSRDAREFLSTLPRRRDVAGLVTLAHGSLDDPERRIVDLAGAQEQLARLEAEESLSRFLVLGHTHHFLVVSSDEGHVPVTEGRPLRLRADGRYLVNPSSVGQSRQRRLRARFMLLETGTGELTAVASRYDLRRARRELRRAGLPSTFYGREPRRLRDRVRAVVRRLG